MKKVVALYYVSMYVHSYTQIPVCCLLEPKTTFVTKLFV